MEESEHNKLHFSLLVLMERMKQAYKLRVFSFSFGSSFGD